MKSILMLSIGMIFSAHIMGMDTKDTRAPHKLRNTKIVRKKKEREARFLGSLFLRPLPSNQVRSIALAIERGEEKIPAYDLRDNKDNSSKFALQDVIKSFGGLNQPANKLAEKMNDFL